MAGVGTAAALPGPGGGAETKGGGAGGSALAAAGGNRLLDRLQGGSSDSSVGPGGLVAAGSGPGAELDAPCVGAECPGAPTEGAAASEALGPLIIPGGAVTEPWRICQIW